MHKYSTLIICLLFISTNIFSQSTTKFIDSGSVKNQIDYLIDKSNSYQDYKVVKYTWLSKIKSNVLDSLAVSKKEIVSNYNTIETQKKKIDSLKISLNDANNQIVSLKTEIESISLFGIQLKKGIFKTILFVIIIILLTLLAFFITKFKQSDSVISQVKLNLKEVEEEFEEHRKRALEREQKAMRRLQDELNKQKKE
jgi:hypothetical protein